VPPLQIAVILADEIGCDVCDFLDAEGVPDAVA
jgi:hypothetical protein